jgi:flagellar export protein FliJ
MSFKTVIEYRRHREDLAREELATVGLELGAQLERINTLEIELQRILGEMVRQKQEGTSAAEALAFHRFTEAHIANLRTARCIAQDLQSRLEERRAVLMEAARDCRIVEKLETRRAQERLRIEERREQRQSDETSLRRWQHQHVGQEVDLG